MLEYTIIGAVSHLALSESVNEHIEDGWQPIGGVAVAYDPKAAHRSGGYETNGCIIAHQAMVREREES